MKLKNIYLLTLALFWAACGEPDYPTPTPSVTTLTSKLTLVHAAPETDETPRVLVKVDNRALSDKDTLRFEPAPNGKFYNKITLSIPAGPNRLVNYTELGGETTFFTDRYSATASTNNTAFLLKTVTNGEEVYTVRRVADDLTVPDVGSAKIRFFNFAFGGPEVKVTTVGGATQVFSARKYNEVSRTASGTTTDFARFTTTSVGLTGTTVSYEVRSTVDDSILLTIDNLKLNSKGIYTIYLKGRAPTYSYDVITH
jgi:hypothetical protein